MKAAVCSVLVLALLAPLAIVRGEDPPPRPKSFRVDLSEGLGYWCYVPEPCKTGGDCGVLLILDSEGTEPARMLARFTGAYNDGRNYLAEMKWIGIAPESREGKWRPNDVTPMKALTDVIGKYAINMQRIHVWGFEGGGGVAAMLGYSRPDIFKTVVTFASSIGEIDPGLLKKHPQKRVYMVMGEKDKALKQADKAMKVIKKAGGRYARLRSVSGMDAAIPIDCELPALSSWYEAMDCGFDYAEALDEATRKLTISVEDAIRIVADVEKHPREDEFWLELAHVKECINRKGETNLIALLAKAQSAPEEVKMKLLEIEKIFAGYPVAIRAQEELKKLSAPVPSTSPSQPPGKIETPVATPTPK
ncbi:MAG: hypothetical protein WC712_10990 [Candidatus Brocadiia bacterium]